MLQLKSYCSILQLVILVQLITAAVFVESSDTFQLQFTNRSSNAITLSCRGAQDPGAAYTFFLNNSELANYPGFTGNYASQPSMFTFQINRELEGIYSCGIGEVRSSNNISLIAYPTRDASILHKRNTYFAVAGTTAVLNCAVSPGALIHYYYVIWRNGSRPLFTQSLPSQRSSNSTFPNSVDPRYRLDPMNLSLIIDDVCRSDSIQDYHCELYVVDPATENGASDDYEITRNVDISLTVLSPPVITENPGQGTVSQGANAIFSCKAKGYPLPTISWMHNGKPVTESQADYLVTPYNEGSTMAISDLRIFSVSADRTGEVFCIASANSPVDSGITLDNAAANTSLTVLGMFRKVDVYITTHGDVIFSLELPIVYSQSIHLFLKYTDDHDHTKSYNRTTEIGFQNTRKVQYMEHSSQVYYKRFRVKLGLVSGPDTHGPLLEAPGVHDRTKTTFCESGFDPRYSVMFGILAMLFFILCIALVAAICIVSLMKSRDLSNLSKSITTYLKDQKAGQTAKDQTQSDLSTPSKGRLDSDSSDTQPQVGDQGRSASKMYRSSPIYGDVKEVLKGAKLTGRKYKLLKEELKKDCNQNP